MSTAELDRSTLDTKDREQLHAIAGAMGVKAPTRMRKAELIDAILAAATGEPSATSGNGDSDDAPNRRTIRSARASELEAASIDALAAEEDALATDGDDADDLQPRPVRRQASTDTTTTREGEGDGDGVSGQDSSRPTQDRDGGGGADGTSTADDVQIDPEDERASLRRRQPDPRTASPASRPRWPGGRGTSDPGARRRPGPRPGTARAARRGLRVPAHPRLPRRSRRRLRLGLAGAPVQPPQGRLRGGLLAPAGEQREVPGPAARRHGQRPSRQRMLATARASKTSHLCSPTSTCTSSAMTIRWRSPGASSTSSHRSGRASAVWSCRPRRPGRRRSSSRSCTRSSATTRRCTSWCCSSTSGPKR